LKENKEDLIMKLIVRGADYGMTDSITDGCLKAARDGILTDVGLMTNNEKQAKRAVEEMKKYPHVSFGQDLNLVSGMPASDPKDIPSLVDENGIFISSVQRKKKNLYQIPYDEIYHEMKLQVERFIQLVGHKPSYLAGHSLSTPEVNLAMKNIAEEYDILLDCFSRPNLPTGERWYYKNIKVDPKDRKPDYNLEAQGATDVTEYILSGGCQFDFNGEYAMLATHCGYCDGELMKMSTFSVVRGKELEALCSPRIRQWLEDNHITLINFDEYLEEQAKG
jgi:predicted glycoside hydrolase/deacetylase ChbG (UPF0249 family)